MAVRTKTKIRRAVSTLLCCASLGALAQEAQASGLYFSERGVRPLARGGAFTAGADDLGAIYYNPAGIAEAGTQILADMSWVRFSSDYQRRSRLDQVDPNTGRFTGTVWERTYPSVSGTSPILPIPTLAVSTDFGQKDFNFAFGLWAPYAAIPNYPETLENGEPAPQRHSLLSLEGSAMAVVGGWAAWKASPELSLGAGLEALVGDFNASVVLNACPPERLACAPEDPAYDAKSQLHVGTIVAPSGNAGLIYAPSKDLRLGAAFQLPFWIDAPARVRVRLPSAVMFDEAAQAGDEGRVQFRLPWVLRTGVEYRGFENARIELGFVYEAWSMHDSIVAIPDDIVLQNVLGIDYRVGRIEIPRNFKDSFSLRLGAEYGLKIGRKRLDVRADAMYESSAVPQSHLSVMTIDLDKVIASVGGSLHLDRRLRLDAVYARVMGIATEVSTSEASITHVNPIRANPPESPTAINAGSYSARADVLGIGLAYRFD